MATPAQSRGSFDLPGRICIVGLDDGADVGMRVSAHQSTGARNQPPRGVYGATADTSDLEVSSLDETIQVAANDAFGDRSRLKCGATWV
jgi:hypothetical protein